MDKLNNFNKNIILGTIVPECERECAARHQRLDGAPLGSQAQSPQHSQPPLQPRVGIHGESPVIR